jgi:hypothetical protein
VRGDVVVPLPLAPVLDPEQFADSMRTEVTRICCVFALVSDPDVPTADEFRARREAREVVAGMTIPETSTRCPTWLASVSPCSMYDELPDALLGDAEALDAPAAPLGPVDEPPDDTLAFESM